MKTDYTEAQKLRNKGLTLREIAKRTGLNRSTIGRYTTAAIKKKSKPIKEGNQELLYKGVAKIPKNAKVFENRIDRDAGTRKVRVNHNTEIYTRCATDEEAIRKFNERHGGL